MQKCNRKEGYSVFILFQLFQTKLSIKRIFHLANHSSKKWKHMPCQQLQRISRKNTMEHIKCLSNLFTFIIIDSLVSKQMTLFLLQHVVSHYKMNAFISIIAVCHFQCEPSISIFGFNIFFFCSIIFGYNKYLDFYCFATNDNKQKMNTTSTTLKQNSILLGIRVYLVN